MMEDGILINFETSDTPFIPKRQFHGGKWKDRLIAKKCAAKRLNRALSKPSGNKIITQKRNEVFGETSRLDDYSSQPKRRRISNFSTNSNHVIGGEQNYLVHQGEENEKESKSDYGNGIKPSENVNSESEKKLFGREITKSVFISGKLPRGSININGPSLVNNSKILNTHLHQDFVGIGGKKRQENLDVGSETSAKKIIFDDVHLEDNSSDRNEKKTGNRDLIKTKNSDQIVSSLFSYNPAAKTKSKPGQELSNPEPSNAPLPSETETFTALGLTTRLASHLSVKLGVKAPTAIQKVAIPLMIKEDRDIFIQAQTGSGKTMAYLIPIVQRITAISNNGAQVHRDSGLFAIILTPTRELCKQVATVLDKLLRCTPWIVGTTVIGGESKQSEKARIRKGVNILIATPGRLLDHLNSTEVLKVDSVRWLVLDEGDRLIDLGFEEEIKQIVEKLSTKSVINSSSTYLESESLPKRRINILCSATMKMNVQRLGEISLQEAVHIVADQTEKNILKNTKDGYDENLKSFSAPTQLKQAYTVVPAKLRLVTLVAILKNAFARRGSIKKVIVFISCADSVDFHFSLFSRSIGQLSESNRESSTSTLANTNRITKDSIAPCATISSPSNTVMVHRLHGSLMQNTRTAVLKAFTLSSEPCVILCTDVASRGLDLPNVDLVIEYDPPFCADDHLHRVGRTARAGKDGRALIFLLPGEEEEYVSILASGYKEGKKALTFHSTENLLQKGFGGCGKEWEDRATKWQLDTEKWVQDSPKYLEMARRGFQSHIRAYATHIASERHIFDMKALHFGHLAKSFALRDKPSCIKLPGHKSGNLSKLNRSITVGKSKNSELEDKIPEGERIRKQRKLDLDLPRVKPDDISKRMRLKMKEHASTVSEFNII